MSASHCVQRATIESRRRRPRASPRPPALQSPGRWRAPSARFSGWRRGMARDRRHRHASHCVLFIEFVVFRSARLNSRPQEFYSRAISRVAKRAPSARACQPPFFSAKLKTLPDHVPAREQHRLGDARLTLPVLRSSPLRKSNYGSVRANNVEGDRALPELRLVNTPPRRADRRRQPRSDKISPLIFTRLILGWTTWRTSAAAPSAATASAPPRTARDKTR